MALALDPVYVPRGSPLSVTPVPEVSTASAGFLGQCVHMVYKHKFKQIKIDIHGK